MSRSQIIVQTVKNTIEVVNNAPQVTVEDPVNTLTFDVNKVQIISVGTQGPEGAQGPTAGPGTDAQKLEFVGLGTGSTKTTTLIVGTTTLAEAFDVGDELYLQWVLPTGVDRSVAPNLVGSFFPTSSESGKTVSWQIDFLADEHGGDLGGLTATKYMIDIPLTETQYEAQRGSLEFPNGGFLTDNVDAVHIRVKRIASSADPSARVAIEHLAVEFTTDGKVGEGGVRTVTYTSGEALAAYRIVRIAAGIVTYADKDTPAHEGTVLGITTTAVSDASSVTVVVNDEITNENWSWSAGAVYLDNTGQLTQTAPVSGFVQIVGVALTATTILFRIS